MIVKILGVSLWFWLAVRMQGGLGPLKGVTLCELLIEKKDHIKRSPLICNGSEIQTSMK